MTSISVTVMSFI